MSRRCARLADGREPVILIPRDTSGGTASARVARAVRWLWSRGIYPGPAAMGLRLHGRARRDLNGREVPIRNRVMQELGIARQRRKESK